MELVCPLCGGTLQRQEKRYVCPDNHSFDIARQGYVHLLPVQNKHSRNPGDTREQVLSRRAFLESGYYAPIADALAEEAKALNLHGEILDVGCGEGWYSAALAETLGLPLTGLDISKEAVRCAAAKYKGARWLCATASHIPVPDGSAALLMSLFAITLPEEFHRVLSPGGLYFQVLAAEDHRFYRHNGIDLFAIAEAFMRDVRERRLAAGGSTITQQLCKNQFFTQQKLFTRKIAEVFMVRKLEQHCSKDEILELYINSIYYGSGYYNLADAATGYFGKQIVELTAWECTLLAGIPNAPSVYAPTKNPGLALQRQQQVLDAMVEYGYLTCKEADEILQQCPEDFL